MKKKKNSLPPKILTDSSIAAYCIVSESEIAAGYPDYSNMWDDTRRLKKVLFDLGIDITRPVEIQDNLTHRNRLNQVVTCRRYVGHERQDTVWITSGHASRFAIDKFSKSKILEDIYRWRGLTYDRQAQQEARDQYRVEDELVLED